MQKLHLVGFTADFDGLIFSARKGAKSGSFVIPIDGRPLKQMAEAERLREGGPVRGEEHRLSSPRLVRPESALNPREMQDRIRRLDQDPGRGPGGGFPPPPRDPGRPRPRR